MSDKENAQFHRYAQLTTAYAFTKALFEWGVDAETLHDICMLAAMEQQEVLTGYQDRVGSTPENTRKELADLEYRDLLVMFVQLEKEINLERNGDDGA